MFNPSHCWHSLDGDRYGAVCTENNWNNEGSQLEFLLLVSGFRGLIAGTNEVFIVNIKLGAVSEVGIEGGAS